MVVSQKAHINGVTIKYITLHNENIYMEKHKNNY